MKNDKIRVLKSFKTFSDEELTLNQLNSIVGRGVEQDGVCIKYWNCAVGDCFIEHCGLKLGCIERVRL